MAVDPDVPDPIAVARFKPVDIPVEGGPDDDIELGGAVVKSAELDDRSSVLGINLDDFSR